MFIFIFRTTLSGTTTYRLIGLFPTHAAAANTGVRLWMILAGKVSPTSKGIDGAFEVYVPEMRYVIQVVEMDVCEEPRGMSSEVLDGVLKDKEDVLLK
jgi:hypothetical protein